jgi:CBS domain-containing protein
MGNTMLPLAILMSRDLMTIPHDATLKRAACLMRDRRIGSLLVVQNDHHVGILSETDLVRRGLAEGLDPDKATVKTIMSSPIITLDIEKSAEDANAMMSEKGIRHLAITEEGKIAGILSVRDLLIYFKNLF